MLHRLQASSWFALCEKQHQLCFFFLAQKLHKQYVLVSATEFQTQMICNPQKKETKTNKKTHLSEDET